MIRYRLRELIADRSFKRGSTLTISEVAEGTGIARRVLTSIANERGYNAGIENVDKLCRYFDCVVSDVLEYVRDEQVALDAKAVSKHKIK
jgi:DNA-binding Xre family transcriptional regulator